MTTDDKDALLTFEEAADELQIDQAGLEEAMTAGELRRVSYEGATYVLTADVAKYAADRDPRALAKRVGRL